MLGFIRANGAIVNLRRCFLLFPAAPLVIWVIVNHTLDPDNAATTITALTVLSHFGAALDAIAARHPASRSTASLELHTAKQSRFEVETPLRVNPQ